MCRLLQLPCLGVFAILLAVCWAQAEDEPPERPVSRRGSAPIPQAREIRHALQARNETPRLKLFERLFRLGAEADRPEVLAAISEGIGSRISQKTSDIIDWELVELLANYKSDGATDILLACLQAKDWQLALTALQGLLDSQRADHWDAVASMKQRSEYPHVYALRRATVDYAEFNASRPAIDFLIDTVQETQGQLKYEAAVSLTKLTGQEFGGRAAEWRNWWEMARTEFFAVPTDEQQPISLAKRKFAWDEPVPEFFKLPVYAYRVAFILDRSRSMASSVGGETRIDRARKELENAVQQLPEGTEFNVLAYHDSVSKFVPGLIRATSESKRQAILFATELDPEKLTACYNALVAGLEVDPNLEVIYFLSDGEPTTGTVVKPPKIVEAVTKRNRLQLTSIYTLGIDARDVHENFLRRLATRNRGEFFLIR